MSNYRKPQSQGFNMERAFHDRVMEEGGGPAVGAGPASPVGHVRHYEANHVDNRDAGAFAKGGIKIWSQEPHKGRGPDPRGFQHHDNDGVPIVTSRREINEVVARTAETNNPLIWERD